MLLLSGVLSTIALILQILREGYFPTKIRLENDGIYIWKRNKKEEYISMDNIHSIENTDALTPKEFKLIKKNNRDDFFYFDIILDYDSAQKILKILKRYKQKKN
jgi:hypothetical protein